MVSPFRRSGLASEMSSGQLIRPLSPAPLPGLAANAGDSSRGLQTSPRHLEQRWRRLTLFQQLSKGGLFYGTVDEAAVYAREVVRTALRFNASACIPVHNHPSGNAEPSEADCAITKRPGRPTNDRRVRVGSHRRRWCTQTRT